MEICRCCYNCSNALLGDDATWDCPPTFYGCMLDKDISVHKNGWGKNLDCFVYEEETQENKKQKQIKIAKIFKERIKQRELAELKRLKAKYEISLENITNANHIRSVNDGGSLIICYDCCPPDTPTLIVAKKDKDNIIVLNGFQDDEAVELYNKLIGEARV